MTRTRFAMTTASNETPAIIAAMDGLPAPLIAVAATAKRANAATPKTRIERAGAPARYSAGYASRITPCAAPEVGAATSRRSSKDSRMAC